MVLLHGHLQVLVYEAKNVGRAYYSKKSIFKSFFKGCAQNAKQAVEKTKHADRDCYVAVYAGICAASDASSNSCLVHHVRLWCHACWIPYNPSNTLPQPALLLQMPDMHLSSANANSCPTTGVTSYMHGQARCSYAYSMALAL